MKVSVTDIAHWPTQHSNIFWTDSHMRWSFQFVKSPTLCIDNYNSIALITLHRKNEEMSWKVASEKQSYPFFS